MKFTLSAAVALAIAGGIALAAFPALLRAQDESPHETVERLMPQLLSDDDTSRADAERRVFELGDSGRRELERVTRESDPRRAVTALRLLQSSKWPKATPTTSGEQRVHRDGADPQAQDDPTDRVDSLRAQIERQMEEMSRRFEQFDGRLGGLPELGLRGPTRLGRSEGSVVENDRKLTWSTQDDGRIKVTVQDGKDAPEQTFEAKDLDELRREHPDVAKRIEPMLGGSVGRSFTFRFDPKSRELLRGDRSRPDVLRLDAPQAQVLGIEWSPVSDVLREQIDLAAGGVVVESVVTGSLAEKLGLARFDVLVEVNGKTVSGSPDVRAALETTKAGDKVAAVVVRKGQRKSLTAVK